MHGRIRQRRQHLAGLVAVVIDRLLAHDHKARLLLGDHALKILATVSGSTSPSVLTRMPRSAPIARAVRSVSLACAGPIDTTTTSVACRLLLAERLLDGYLVNDCIDMLTLASSTPDPSDLMRILML